VHGPRLPFAPACERNRRLLASAREQRSPFGAAAKTAGPDAKLLSDDRRPRIRFLAHNSRPTAPVTPRWPLVNGPGHVGPSAERRTPADPQVPRGSSTSMSFAQESGGSTCRRADPDVRILHRLDLLQGSQSRRAVRPSLSSPPTPSFRGGQWDESRGKDKSDVYYGGVGYGGNRGPFVKHGLFDRRAEVVRGGPDDKAIQKALVFVSRCQNSKASTTPPSSPLK